MDVRSTERSCRWNERLFCPDWANLSPDLAEGSPNGLDANRLQRCWGDMLEISEELTDARLKTGDRYNESSRLAAPVLPKAFSERVRAAEKSGFFGTRRENVVFSAVESWLNFGTINAGHSRRTPRNRTASSKPPQLEDKFYFKIFSSPAFSVLLEDGWKLRLFWKNQGLRSSSGKEIQAGIPLFLLPHSALFPRMSQAGKKRVSKTATLLKRKFIPFDLNGLMPEM